MAEGRFGGGYAAPYQFWGKYYLGDYAEREPPLPIPNREVKPLRADDIEFLEKVGRRQDNGFLRY